MILNSQDGESDRCIANQVDFVYEADFGAATSMLGKKIRSKALYQSL